MLRRRFNPLILVGIVGGIALIVVLFFRISMIQNEIRSLRGGIQTEVEAQNQRTVLLESNQRQAVTDLQELRRLMNMSPGSYRFPDTGPASPTPSTAPTATLSADAIPNELFYQGIERIEWDRRLTELERDLTPVIPELITSALRAVSEDLAIASTGRLEWTVSDSDGSMWLRVVAEPDAATLYSPIADPIRRETVYALSDEIAPTLRSVAERFGSYRAGVEELIAFLNHSSFQQRLQEQDLALGKRDRRPGLFVQPFVTLDGGTEVFSVTFRRSSMEYEVDDDPTGSLAKTRTVINELVASIDPRTAGKQRVGAAFDRIAEVAQDDTFREYLDQRELSLDLDARDTQDFYLFDIVRSNGSLFGSFAVQKGLGTIYLTDSDEIVITQLRNAASAPLTMEEKQEETQTRSTLLPDEYPPGFRVGHTDGTNIVLLGIHEERADSIMLVHLSPERTISMISIPRDIWWRQRKLNYYHEVYGSEALVEEISTLVDQPIDGWIAIDMYAFIDVVDILGGITVTLDEPLVDPTYQTREHGEWGTLSYEAGTHHLSGIEALRLARSRHSSNDFDRASRQQTILEALRDRFGALHAGDIGKLYGLVETIMRYVESSYSPWEIAQFYLRYRDAAIVNKTGITFDNVLYATWSNLYLRGLEEDEVSSDFYKGAWILLPREGDWNVIPWFISENLR